MSHDGNVASPQQKDSARTSQKTVRFCQEDQSVNVLREIKVMCFYRYMGEDMTFGKNENTPWL